MRVFYAKERSHRYLFSSLWVTAYKVAQDCAEDKRRMRLEYTVAELLQKSAASRRLYRSPNARTLPYVDGLYAARIPPP